MFSLQVTFMFVAANCDREDMVRQYLDLHDQQLQKKISDLYYGKFIRHVRYSCCDAKTYISSRISAEMFKNCVYNVDISLDAHGIVLEAQSECKAGLGPQATTPTH